MNLNVNANFIDDEECATTNDYLSDRDDNEDEEQNFPAITSLPLAITSSKYQELKVNHGNGSNFESIDMKERGTETETEKPITTIKKNKKRDLLGFFKNQNIIETIWRRWKWNEHDVGDYQI